MAEFVVMMSTCSPGGGGVCGGALCGEEDSGEGVGDHRQSGIRHRQVSLLPLTALSVASTALRFLYFTEINF